MNLKLHELQQLLAHYWFKLLGKIRYHSSLGSNIHNTVTINGGSYVWRSTFGKHSYCGYGCKILNCDVGAFCSIADFVSIGLAAHPLSYVSTSPYFLVDNYRKKSTYTEHEFEASRRTIIGNDVWIGEKVLVKAGISIGNGSVIGMGSVVTKDVLPYSIVAGNPAKLIRFRFEQDTISHLQKSEWWNYSESKLNSYAPFFSNTLAFIQKLQSQ